MAIVLLITTKDQETMELPLLGKLTLGRSRSSDLVINDKKMSGRHGTFELTKKGEILYTDHGSTNGSHLNESQIEKIIFRIYETLRLGNTTVTIDEKRLNSRESIAIGMGLTSGQKLEVPPLKTSKSTSVKSKSSGQTLILDVKKKKK